MEIKGEYNIPTDRETVWKALNDVEVLGQTIPGCEEIEQQSPTEMTATVRAKIGPVKARFKGGVTLEDIDAPNGYKIVGEGQGGAAGFAKGHAVVTLSDNGEGGTILSYDAEAKVGGKLAAIGSRLVAGTARKLANQFFRNFAEYLVPGSTAETDDEDEDAEA